MRSVNGFTVGRKMAVAAAVVVGTALLGPLAAPAEARGNVSVGFGFYPAYPYYPPRPVYVAPPPVYYAPPAYYAPAPTYYAPPQQPVYVQPGPTFQPVQPQASNGYCREYQSTQIVGGRPQTMVGTACQQPDGSWRIVN
jgi:hypothetical protein